MSTTRRWLTLAVNAPKFSWTSCETWCRLSTKLPAKTDVCALFFRFCLQNRAGAPLLLFSLTHSPQTLLFHMLYYDEILLKTQKMLCMFLLFKFVERLKRIYILNFVSLLIQFGLFLLMRFTINPLTWLSFTKKQVSWSLGLKLSAKSKKSNSTVDCHATHMHAPFAPYYI